MAPSVEATVDTQPAPVVPLKGSADLKPLSVRVADTTEHRKRVRRQELAEENSVGGKMFTGPPL